MSKNILILSDFVGYGNVAMATSRAVLTKLGHTVYCLPTALISNTWNFGSVAQLDTTTYLRESIENWDKLGFTIDGVLIGYIANEEQARWIGAQCEEWHARGVKIILDPIFADNGKLYHGITTERLDFLRKLLPLVDYILPNPTEAQFLSETQDIQEALVRLVDLGVGCALITGTKITDLSASDPEIEGQNAVLAADRNGFRIYPYQTVEGSFSGAGDAFAAVFTGKIMAGASTGESIQTAIDTTREWIEDSLRENWKGMGLPVERYF